MSEHASFDGLTTFETRPGWRPIVVCRARPTVPYVMWPQAKPQAASQHVSVRVDNKHEAAPVFKSGPGAHEATRETWEEVLATARAAANAACSD